MPPYSDILDYDYHSEKIPEGEKLIWSEKVHLPLQFRLQFWLKEFDFKNWLVISIVLVLLIYFYSLDEMFIVLFIIALVPVSLVYFTISYVSNPERSPIDDFFRFIIALKKYCVDWLILSFPLLLLLFYILFDSIDYLIHISCVLLTIKFILIVINTRAYYLLSDKSFVIYKRWGFNKKIPLSSIYEIEYYSLGFNKNYIKIIAIKNNYLLNDSRLIGLLKEESQLKSKLRKQIENAVNFKTHFKSFLDKNCNYYHDNKLAIIDEKNEQYLEHQDNENEAYYLTSKKMIYIYNKKVIFEIPYQNIKDIKLMPTPRIKVNLKQGFSINKSKSNQQVFYMKFDSDEKSKYFYELIAQRISKD